MENRWAEWRSRSRSRVRPHVPTSVHAVPEQYGGITCTLRGCADRKHGQKRERHDRAKWANPSKRDTSANAVTRHHRCSSIRQGLMRNVSQEAPSRLQWITARISNSLPCHSPRKRGMTLRNESVSSAPLQHVPLSRKIRERSSAYSRRCNRAESTIARGSVSRI